MTRKDERHTRSDAAGRDKILDQVTEADIKEMEKKLLENVSPEWSKASRIVLTTMIEREEGVTGLSETFYFERIQKLVKEGLVEARGDLTDMHTTEVRLAKKM